MRGLKHLIACSNYINLSVASFTDAWIETRKIFDCKFAVKVASFTDAWIETVSWRHCEKTLASHLLQMRGLKLFWRYQP